MARTIQGQSTQELEESLRELEGTVREYVSERPLTAVSAAFALGYILGGGLTPRLTWLALTAAGRMSLLNMMNEVAFTRSSSRRAVTNAGNGQSGAGRVRPATRSQ
jgi:hypothetical protein